ncbi:MAG TPA: MaoC family dehydratase [Acidimicrobiia bacterium]|nr:MaoC family dehydratase [Acidimicrobiia bacterium]
MRPPPAPLVFGPITRSDVVRYQGASGDFQPIHHDEPFAREAGYDAPLVVGMLPAGLLTTWATDWLGPANVRRSRVRWTERVWPGDTLTCSGTVEREHVDDDGQPLVDLVLQAVNQDGAVVVQGWMTFVNPEG